MKVLQICHKMPFPPADGGAQVMHFSTMGLLQCGVDVKVLAINPTRQFVAIESIDENYKLSVCLESVVVDTRIKPLNFIFNLFKKESYFTERFSSVEFENKLGEILSKENFDIIQLEHLYLCKFLPVIRKLTKSKVILRPQNIEYVVWQRFSKRLSNPFKKFALNIAIRRLVRFEQRSANLVDAILPLTLEDQKIFESFTFGIPMEIVPMGYDYTKINNYDWQVQYESPLVAYHLGTMDWLPNEEAIKWFLEKVAQHLKIQKLKFKIVIAGNKMQDWVFKYNTDVIEIMGAVANPIEFQKNKQMMIVPLLSGSGIRAKIIEGLALGKAIISTTIGAQGIEYTEGKDILIADTPEEFADKMILLGNDLKLCKELGANARKLSEKKYNHIVIAQSMIKFYNSLIKNG